MNNLYDKMIVLVKLAFKFYLNIFSSLLNLSFLWFVLFIIYPRFHVPSRQGTFLSTHFTYVPAGTELR